MIGVAHTCEIYGARRAVAVDVPVFYYDFNSPYAYLAATRVDALMPAVRWQPIALAFVLRARARTPWSMRAATRDAGMRECEQRAAVYGLAPFRWPPGWPVESYSLLPLRAACVADDHGRLKEFSAAAFAHNFADGAGLTNVDDVRAVVSAAGLPEAVVLEQAESPAAKQRLTAATEAAIARGVIGVPTVAIGDGLFWGDDQLEAAAAAISST